MTQRLVFMLIKPKVINAVTAMVVQTRWNLYVD